MKSAEQQARLLAGHRTELSNAVVRAVYAPGPHEL